MLGSLLSFIVVAAVVYLLAKRYRPQPVLFFAGVVLMLLTAALGIGPILPANESTNLIWLDIFQVPANLLSARLAGLGLMLMAIGGFARYMDHVGASKALFAIFGGPLRYITSPYLLLVVAFLVTQILVIFIPSHAGLGLLLMVTMYPLLIRRGVSKLSALGVIGCCQFIDHGPGSGNEILAAQTSKLNPAVYFVNHQLPVTIPIILAVAVTHFFVQRWWDKREGYVCDPNGADKADSPQIAEDRPPLVYAALPIIPLVLIIGFSPVFKTTIKMDVVTAMLLSTVISILFEYVRLRNTRAVLESLMLFFEGMGNILVVVVSLIVCGEIFANGLLKTGVIDTLIASAQAAGLGLKSMIVIASLILAASAFIMGSGNAAFFSFAALTPKIAGFLNVDTVTFILPLQIMTSFGRAVSPITAAIVAIAGIAGVSPFQVVKRTAIPMAVAAVVNIVMTFIYLAK
jgi:DcuC family C4-dicarboxylate transporter